MDHRRGGVEGGNLEPAADSEAATRQTIDYEMAMGDDDDIEMLADSVRRRPRCQTAADVLDNWNKKYDEGEITDHHFREWWRQAVPKVLSPTPSMDYLNPSAHIDEEQVKVELFDPMEKFLCAIDNSKQSQDDMTAEKVLEDISKMNDPPSQCGKMFRHGEPTYSCRDCGHDPTCVLCIECFKNSEHQHHRYKMSTSYGGGYCDCGDPEAWSSGVHCSIHARGMTSQEGGSGSDPLSKLPAEVQKRARHVFIAVLNYAYEMLTTETFLNLPADLTFKRVMSQSDLFGQGGSDSVFDFSPFGLSVGGGKGHADGGDIYAAVVFNDEIHTFDEVIDNLPRAADVDKETAMGFATLIDREGRCLVRCAGFAACSEVKNTVEKKSMNRSGKKPLKVQVMLGHVVAHQTFALRLLSWIQTILDKSVGFRALFSQIMFDKTDRSAKISRLENFIRHDTCLWKSARSQVHHLFVSGMLLEHDTKRMFAEVFTRIYGHLMKDYINDDHEHSFSITSLSVQIFTVPTLAHHLVSQCHVLFNLINTFLSECERKRNSSGKLEFHRNLNTQTFKRATCILTDLKYVLTTAPKENEWTDDLRKGFLHGVAKFVNVLSMVQGMDQQTRQINHHIEYEQEWEAGFNIAVKLAPIHGLIVNWCKTDRIVYIKTVRLIFKKLHEDCGPSGGTREGDTSGFKFTDVQVHGHSTRCLDYQVSSKPISFHQPLTRLLAALAVHMADYGLDFDANEFTIPEKPTPMVMMEPSLRLAVVVAQVFSGMWRRNGYSVLEQIRVYHDSRCRKEMQDQDVLMLQIGASLMNPDDFLVHLLQKFQLTQWAEADFDITEDDSVRQTITLVEEFFSNLIVLVSERYTPGVGKVSPEDGLRREIIQMLCEEPMTHSHLNRSLTEGLTVYSESQMEKVVKSVANFKKPTSASSSGLAVTNQSGKGVYELKPEFFKEYNVFFYHYDKQDQSKSELGQRKRKKAAGEPECHPPPVPPEFTRQFKAISDLLQCDIYVYIIHLVLKRADNLKSRCFSENLVHRALHLIGLSLLEEERCKADKRETYEFTSRASAPQYDMYNLLTQLIGSQRIESHKHLLEWVMNKWRTVVGATDEAGNQALTPAPHQMASTGSSDAETEKKRKAAERRKMIMAQMQKAQKNFMQENAKLFDAEGGSGGSSGEGGAKSRTASESVAMEDDTKAEETPVALGPKRSPPATTETLFTCILCQQEEKLLHDGKTLVMASFVQKSTVMSNKKCFDDGDDDDKLAMATGGAATSTSTKTHLVPTIQPDVLPADLYCVPHISSCGHVMHSDCFEHFFDDIMTSQANRSRMRQQESYSVDKREFLCPMCRCLSNSVIPLIPQYVSLQPQSVTPEEEPRLGFSEWLAGMVLATKYIKELPPPPAESDDEDERAADEAAAEDAINRQLFYTCPLAQVVQEMQLNGKSSAAADTFSRIYNDLEYTELAFSMETKQMMNSVSRAVCQVGFDKSVSLDDARTPLATWQATAFTLHSVVWSCLESGKKSILDPVEMASRHKECLSAMIRFSGVVGSYFCEPKVIRSHSLKLLSILLDTVPSNLSILEVDAVGMLVSLTFSIPSLFNGDFSAPLPAGNIQDLHILRLVYIMHLCQILLTTDKFTSGMEQDGGDDVSSSGPILSLLHKVRSAVGFASEGDGTEGLNADAVWSDVKHASLPFLRCAALFYHHLTNVGGPEDLAHLADDEYSVLTSFLSLPSNPMELLAEVDSLDGIVQRWTNHPRVSKLLRPSAKVNLVSYPLKVNCLIALPHDYSELINSTSGFTCPKPQTDEARVPTMCLVCGQVLCSQCYCCLVELDGKNVGACTAHAETCSGGYGIFLRLRECKVVLLAGRPGRSPNGRGIFIQPPYVDQYGETDAGLRRGNPLHLCQEKYRKLYKLWLNHAVPKEITSSLESNPMFMTTEWYNL